MTGESVHDHAQSYVGPSCVTVSHELLRDSTDAPTKNQIRAERDPQRMQVQPASLVILLSDSFPSQVSD
jgi:hypothetical protein